LCHKKSIECGSPAPGRLPSVKPVTRPRWKPERGRQGRQESQSSGTMVVIGDGSASSGQHRVKEPTELDRNPGDRVTANPQLDQQRRRSGAVLDSLDAEEVGGSNPPAPTAKALIRGPFPFPQPPRGRSARGLLGVEFAGRSLRRTRRGEGGRRSGRPRRCMSNRHFPRNLQPRGLLKCGLIAFLSIAPPAPRYLCLVSGRTSIAQSTSASWGPGLRHELTGSSDRRMVSPACSTS
jgi:hypothetical protein